jgi:hypothetical protein
MSGARWCAGTLGGALLLMVAAALASEADVAGSRDPAGIDRFPRSTIVDYTADGEVRPRAFVPHRLEPLRSGRGDPGAVPHFDGALESATYRIPEGSTVVEVAAHYRAQPEGGILYQCASRECGRSNEWANVVFGKPVLYGPDANQRYLAWESQGRLVAVYVIERGNKRVYAHVQVLEPAEGALRATALGANMLIARRLAAQGWSVIDGVVPDADGHLPASAAAVLGAVGPALAELAGKELYLVCHLYDRSRTVDALRTAATRCADAGVALLAESLPAGVKVSGLGIGPLSPRGAAPASRLELVAPALITRGVAPAAARPATPRG